MQNSSLKLIALQVANLSDKVTNTEAELKVELGPLRRRMEAAAVYRCFGLNWVNVVTNNVLGNAPGACHRHVGVCVAATVWKALRSRPHARRVRVG